VSIIVIHDMMVCSQDSTGTSAGVYVCMYVCICHRIYRRRMSYEICVVSQYMVYMVYIVYMVYMVHMVYMVYMVYNCVYYCDIIVIYGV
jgi:hypothetical protein